LGGLNPICFNYSDFRLDTRKWNLVRTYCNRDASEVKKPVIISKSLFLGLGPFEQLAAKALERCGSVQIVDDEKKDLLG
jgi:hypothetical protein